MNNRPCSHWHRIAAFASIAKLASLVKVNMILGSYTACFSALALVMPTAGLWCGMGASSLLFGLLLMLRVLVRGAIPLHFLAYHVPGLCAAYYMATRSLLVRCVLPAACVVLFVLHPSGSAAWLYTTYWLIPMALAWRNHHSEWGDALGSTLVAHAVGSTIWIYTMQSTPHLWLSLIPIVALERILFTVGIVYLNRALIWCSHQYRIAHTRSA